ncbi:hypothetical protein [Weissella sagaensis]|uniref:hypothetical protein n=1 Tax=Weissella sagaensis TaxID=2559928 RepID=UPI0013EB3313|nr:hypothetical protein [Weissella sagaensis]
MQYLVIFGALCSAFFGSFYLIATIQGRVQPNKVTWLLWAIAPLISVGATITDTGINWAILPVFMAGFMPLLVFITSMFNRDAYWQLTTLDYLCGVVAILALIVWLATSNPILAIIFSTISDAIAALPTLRKAWIRPSSEAPIYYVGGIISTTTGILAATTHWSFSNVAFTIYLLLLDITLVIIILYRRKVLANKHDII